MTNELIEAMLNARQLLNMLQGGDPLRSYLNGYIAQLNDDLVEALTQVQSQPEVEEEQMPMQKRSLLSKS